MAVLSAAADYSYIHGPKRFSHWGLAYDLVIVTSVLFGCYLATLFQQEEKVLSLAVAFYNVTWLPFVTVAVLYLLFPNLWNPNAGLTSDINTLRWLWSYLIFFQVVGSHFPMQPLRHVLAALVILGATCIPAYYFHSPVWYYDYSKDHPSTENEKSLTEEEILQNQHVLLSQAFKSIQPPQQDKAAYYGIAFGSYGDQKVFMREALFVNDVLKRRLSMDNHNIVLINNDDTMRDMPLATVTNLGESLKFLGSKIRKNKDILILYMTSHGSAQTGISVQMDDFDLLPLPGKKLAELLKNSGIRNRLIIISACYSGALIDDLKDPDTIIMTSAAKDRTSFGCSDEADLTYFANAYFKQALPKTGNLIEAFYEARKLIEEREKAENIKPASNPQIFIGDRIGKIIGNPPQ